METMTFLLVRYYYILFFGIAIYHYYKQGRHQTGYQGSNPLKMWGSWIGAGITSHLLYFNVLPPGVVVGFLSNAIIGFLIGWGIHSLIRKVR